MSNSQQLVERIHATSTRVVLALAGGGSRAVADLLETPGASNTILEVVVPYAAPAMDDWLGRAAKQSCSSSNARAMAMRAFGRAQRLGGRLDLSCQVAGIGVTAALATNRPKRGDHRVHLAIQTSRQTVAHSLILEKGRRTRAEEERLAGRLLLNAVAEACGLPDRLDPGLLENERLDSSSAVAAEAWRALLLGEVDAVLLGDPAGEQNDAGQAILPGAFQPFHVGHRNMVEIGQEILGLPVVLELSIENADKPPLDYLQIERRLDQFDSNRPIWLTRLPTFEEKSARFPGRTFLVGVDTLRRIADPRYYDDNAEAMRRAIGRIVNRGCRFLVFGRVARGSFIRLGDLELPPSLVAVCQEVPPDRFREDVSSTELRRTGGG